MIAIAENEFVEPSDESEQFRTRRDNSLPRQINHEGLCFFCGPCIIRDRPVENHGSNKSQETVQRF